MSNWSQELVAVAKMAGCKYITLTTRHHDGYSLFDTCGLNTYDAPFDQHMLLALIAPRPLYVKSDALDEWADPDATVKSIRLASAVYELYGKPGAVLPEVIKNETAYHEGTVAYHRDSGDHDLNRFDWGCYMDFADRFLK